MSSYKLATYQSEKGPRAGIVVGDTVFDAAELTGRAAYATALDILADWTRAHDMISSAAQSPHAKGWKLAQTHLRAPVLWPSAIYCAGANYSDHAAEMAARMNRPLDPNPKEKGGRSWHFLKSPRAIADPGEVIEAVWYTKKLDWEVELAAVMSRRAIWRGARKPRKGRPSLSIGPGRNASTAHVRLGHGSCLRTT